MSPVPVNDYPRTWSEFLEWFSSEEACVAYLERLRWPQGFVCPSCGGMTPPYRASRVRLLCKDCGHQSTITAGTIFDKTRTPLKVWFAAAWYMTNQKLGISALVNLVLLPAAQNRTKDSVNPAQIDRKSTRLNSSHLDLSRMPSSA